MLSIRSSTLPREEEKKIDCTAAFFLQVPREYENLKYQRRILMKRWICMEDDFFFSVKKAFVGYLELIFLTVPTILCLNLIIGNVFNFH